MGDYDLSAKIGDKTIDTGQSIRVDEYRLPTMRATVSGPKQPAVRPSHLPLDLYVGYLSGGGAGRAPVKLRTAYEVLSDSPDGWDGWTFGGAAVYVHHSGACFIGAPAFFADLLRRVGNRWALRLGGD